MVLLNTNIIDDLKCCGNCSFRHHIENLDHEEEACKYDVRPSCGICKKWKYDNLKKADREEL